MCPMIRVWFNDGSYTDVATEEEANVFESQPDWNHSNYPHDVWEGTDYDNDSVP